MMILDYRIKISHSLNYDAARAINILLTGSRGMGKSVEGMILMNQLARLEVPTQFYCIDYKKSDIYQLKELLPKGRVAGTKKEIFELLENFVAQMKKRAEFVRKHTAFGETAATLGMGLYLLVYDEFGIFTQILTSAERKRHDELISEITLLGRAYNFGLCAILQQASVGNSGLNSNVKEQFGLIAHFGQASPAAYRQTFGESIEIPEIKLNRGQGLIWIQGVTNNRSVVPFAVPDISNIDLWQKFKEAFTEQDDSKYLVFTNK